MSTEFYVECVGSIALHIFVSSNDSAVDAWAAELSRHIETTPPDQTFRVLMDVSSNNVSFTRHARQRSLELFTRYRHRQGRIAFLFSSKTAPHFARIFFASLGKLTFEHGYFSNREKAMEWLRR